MDVIDGSSFANVLKGGCDYAGRDATCDTCGPGETVHSGLGGIVRPPARRAAYRCTRTDKDHFCTAAKFPTVAQERGGELQNKDEREEVDVEVVLPGVDVGCRVRDAGYGIENASVEYECVESAEPVFGLCNGRRDHGGVGAEADDEDCRHIA